MVRSFAGPRIQAPDTRFGRRIAEAQQGRLPATAQDLIRTLTLASLSIFGTRRVKEEVVAALPLRRGESTQVLDRYHLLPAAKADVLRRLGRAREAAAAYRVALARVTNAAERRYLQRRLEECERLV